MNLRPPGPETKKINQGVEFSIHVSGASTVQTHAIPARRSHSFSYGCPGVGASNQGIRNGGWRWVSNVSDRPLVYESRGKLQIQLLCGADDNPRGRMNTGDNGVCDPSLTPISRRQPPPLMLAAWRSTASAKSDCRFLALFKRRRNARKR